MLKCFEALFSKDYSPKLKTQLMLSFTLISFVVLSLGSVAVYLNTRQLMEKQLEELTQQRFSQAEVNINSTLNDSDKITRLLTVDDNIPGIISGSEASDIERNNALMKISSLFDDILETYETVQSLYVIGENGMYIGSDRGSLQYFLVGNTNISGASPDLYNKLEKGKSGLYCTGSFSPADFNMESRSRDGMAGHLITAVRNVRDLNRVFIAKIAVNMSEVDFTNLYNKNENSINEVMYLTDEEGVIISSLDKDLIATRSQAFERIDREVRSGSFIDELTQGKRQIIYRKLENTGWYLISEIPNNLYYNDIYVLQRIIFFIMLASILASTILSNYWVYKMTKPLKNLSAVMKKLEQGDLTARLDESQKNEFGLVSRQYNRMSQSIGELVEKVRSTEEMKKRFEIEALRAQINPHFLYNALNIIKWMAYAANAKSVADAMMVLGNMLKPLFKEHSHLCSLKDEISYLENYITIMNYRFGGILTLNCRIPETLYRRMVLRFALQPVVENCIVHGLTEQRLTLEIELAARQEAGNIILVVSDNGKGIGKDRLDAIKEDLEAGMDNEHAADSTSIGLSNVNKRIKLHFGMEYGISVISGENEGTSVTLRLPDLDATG